MYRVTCNQCGASVITPDGNSDALGCNCCAEKHSHEAAANACPGAEFGHTGVACPEPNSAVNCMVTPEGEECPGEHCHLDIEDCTVCRPVTVEFMGIVPVGMGG